MTTRPCTQVASIRYLENSCDYFERIRHLDFPILLDSNAHASKGRFDIIAAQPAALLSSLSKKSLKHTAKNESIDFFDQSKRVYNYIFLSLFFIFRMNIPAFIHSRSLAKLSINQAFRSKRRYFGVSPSAADSIFTAEGTSRLRFTVD